MNSRPTLLLLIALLVASSSAVAPLGAQIEACALDPGPAATLLLPHFDVDLSRPDGRTTLFSIANTVAEAVLTRVTLWTDLGIPTLTFHVYLTGYDVETVNLRDVFDGNLPRTASVGQDPGGQVSPQGDYSQDLNFESCLNFLPPAPLSTQPRPDRRAEHRGAGSSRLAGLCSGLNHADGLARGYLTIDTVSRCSGLSPKDPGYFSSLTGPGEATAQNVLWGDYFYVEPGQNFASGDALVRIQAFPGRFAAGQRTFYGWLNAGSTADQREPLPFSWSTRFLDGGVFSGGTDLIFWHDVPNPFSPFSCLGLPPGVVLESTDVTYFDEQEEAEIPSCLPVDPPLPCPFRPFPAVASRTPIDGPVLSTSFDFGLLVTSPRILPARQSWMGAVMKASGRFSVGFSGTPLDSGCGTPLCPPGRDCTP